jgi:hypothetical protein
MLLMQQGADVPPGNGARRYFFSVLSLANLVDQIELNQWNRLKIDFTTPVVPLFQNRQYRIRRNLPRTVSKPFLFLSNSPST